MSYSHLLSNVLKPQQSQKYLLLMQVSLGVLNICIFHLPVNTVRGYTTLFRFIAIVFKRPVNIYRPLVCIPSDNRMGWMMVSVCEYGMRHGLMLLRAIGLYGVMTRRSATLKRLNSIGICMMAKSKFDGIVDKMVAGDFNEASVKLTEDELDFLQQHPLLLAKISDGAFIKKKYIYRLFGISVGMMAAAKVLEYGEWLAQYKIINNLLTEVQFSISMELLGATVIAYFLEITLERRVERNKRLVAQIMARGHANESN